MIAELNLPRDAFLEPVFERAKNDKTIYLLSADFGGAVVKKFMNELPNQFLHLGISEQNMINVAEGLALAGNKPYCYAMDCFVAMRCFEQVKVAALNVQNEPEPRTLNIVGVGQGFGYTDSGPTHYTTETIGMMRGIAGLEILSPADNKAAAEAARISFSNHGVRYIRLDRRTLPDVYSETDTSFSDKGLSEVIRGVGMCIISTGYTVGEAIKVSQKLEARGISTGVVDIFRVKPINEKDLLEILKGYRKTATYEDHFVAGGLGEMVAGIFARRKVKMPLELIYVPDTYYFQNASDYPQGGREFIHRAAGIDVDSVVERLLNF